MLYRKIIAVCSEIHTKHINTVCGQNVELLNVKLVVHIVTIVLQSVLNPLTLILLMWRIW
jgi:cytochrome b